MTNKDTTEDIIDFDISTIDAIDTAEMVVVVGDRPTSWKWTFAGPGHPQAIAVSEKLNRERLRRNAAMEQAQVNGKKWKAEEETPAEVARRNAEYVVDRLLGWTPVKMNGEDYPFSRENALNLLLDPKKVLLANQALEFLADLRSFTPRSSNP